MRSCGGEGDVKCQIEIRAGAGTMGHGTHQLADLLGLEALRDDVQGPFWIGRRQLYWGPARHGARPRRSLLCSPRRLFFGNWTARQEREIVTGRHHGSSIPRTSGARREAHDAPATMARHMQLEMTDIDLREVDGEFSDGEYTRARRLSTGACDLCNPETTRRLTSFTGITQAVWCARRWPLAKEACGDVYVSASGCAEGKDPARSTSSPPPSS